VPVVQITYDVPLDIAKGLATGELSTLGTAAVRNSTHIAAHIREVSLTISDGDNAMSAAIAKSWKNPKLVIIGLGVAAVAAVGGGVATWAMSRTQQEAQPAVPECVANYNASLAAYLEAIGSESLNADLVTRLISDLDALKKNVESGTIAIELSVVESEAMVNLVADYTSKFAQANAVPPSVLEEANSGSTGSAVVDLRRYLETQRQIFDESA
jgi:hypothetical protein